MKTGEKYKVYQTVIEADAQKPHGFKMPHGIRKGGAMFRPFVAWLMFETETPLIAESASFIANNMEEYYDMDEATRI